MRQLHPAWLAIVLLAFSSPRASAQSGLARWLETETARMPARTAAYVKHLGTGEEAGVRATEHFNPMSVIKVPIMVRAFLLAEQGQVSLDERVTIARAELRDGTGVLQYHDPGLQPTVRDLITEMIITSDNTAQYGEMEDRIGELARGVVQRFDGARNGQPAPAASPEQELEQLERRLVAAIATKDLVTYDRLVADDYVVVSAAGTERSKAEVIEGYRAGTQGYRGLEISEVKVHVFGDTGLVHARTLGFRIEGGKEIPNRVRYVRVFARRNGRWQAVAQMAQPLPPEQP